MVQQYKAFWSVPNAGECVTTFHAQASSATTAQALADRVRTFFAALASRIPDECAVSFDTEVATLNTLTGVLESVQPVTPGAIVSGADSGNWAAGSGVRVVWATDAIRNGRRVRGSTFLVPLAGSVYAASGRVNSTTTTAIQTAATALRTGLASDSAELLVYSRPRPGSPGAVSIVSSNSVSEMVATLRGRKY